jgi:hypothetical protein
MQLAGGGIKLYNVLVKIHIWTRLFGRPRCSWGKYYNNNNNNNNNKVGCSNEIMTKWQRNSNPIQVR